MARDECCYCEVDDVKLDLGEQWTSGAKYDRALEHAIEEASRLIDDEKGWEICHFAASDLAAVTRLYRGVEGTGTEITVDRFLNDAAVVVEVDESDSGTFTTWTQGTDYILWPYNEAYFTRILVKDDSGKLIPSGQQIVRVTGRLGAYSTPPATIKKCCIITVARWFKRAMQGYQDTGAVEEVGQLTYTKALDPDVKQMLSRIPTRIRIG